MGETAASLERRGAVDATVTSLPLDAKAGPVEAKTGPLDAASPEAYELIELLFFAYRDFVGDPDRVLERYGFGRAHHRVLHFVARNPGLTIAELLDILKITKQSLARVLKELLDQGYVTQRTGHADRRQRLLHTTERGTGLALELAGLQAARIERALRETGNEGSAPDAPGRFLRALIAPEERTAVLSLIGRGRA